MVFFEYDYRKSITYIRRFFKKSQKNVEVLEQLSSSYAIYSRRLNIKAIVGDGGGQAGRAERFSCGAALRNN